MAIRLVRAVLGLESGGSLWVGTSIPPAAQIAARVPGNVTRRAIVVYGAADLRRRSGAEQDRSYQVLAKFGSDA